MRSSTFSLMLLARRTRKEHRDFRLDPATRLRQAARDQLRRQEAPYAVVQSTVVMREVVR